jgi:hypothetical protein
MTGNEAEVCKAFFMAHTKHFRGLSVDWKNHAYHEFDEMLHTMQSFNPNEEVKIRIGDIIMFFDAMGELDNA